MVNKMYDILSDDKWDQDMLEDESQEQLAYEELDRKVITDKNNNTTESIK